MKRRSCGAVHCAFEAPFIPFDPPFIVPFVGAFGSGWWIGVVWAVDAGCPR